MEKILDQFGIKPKNIDIYYQAFTHQTFANEKRYNYTYQRLEFVGDALIDAAVGVYLFNNFPKLSEGEMTLLRAKAVNKDSFAKLSKRLKLGEILRVGNGAEELRENDSILADLFESFTAAIFLDQGREIFEAFMDVTVFEKLRKFSKKELKDSKTLLQEFLQSESREVVKYKTHKDGELFFSKVEHDGHHFGAGKGASKKEAEQRAAKAALKLLKGGK
ncbi:ribonuclease III [Mycoplasma marinum]|uniref:Ribonuclease 3 n=1 Tax=Mycoplasma marinum TaxID=1937190 RepID=A0A4R0XT29_9MOLU|nr:ribonuclease III [Mycoplasma marinum]TCG12053.1 ribonuclease III [Mycoplasma marinum]